MSNTNTWSTLEKLLKEDINKQTQAEIAPLKSKVIELENYMNLNMVNEIQVVINDVVYDKLTEATHEKLPELLIMLTLGFNVLLTGATGSGKTTGAMQAAKALKLDFHAISVGQQTSKSDILGFIDATGKYRTTPFRKCYEKGGVFTMDEIDAGNSNVLIVINSALSNGFCSFPDKQVEKHPDFKFVATANTLGRGRDLQYVGRNPLDLSTLDRFITIDWDYSPSIEVSISSNCKQMIEKARKYIQEHKIEGFISTRTAFTIDRLLKHGYTMKAAFATSLYNKIHEVELKTLMEYLFK